MKLEYKIDFDEIDQKVSHYIDRKRYLHTKGVEMTAACMAMKYGAEAGLSEPELTAFTNRVRLAGLLHDNAKCGSNEELLSSCEAYGIPIRDVERINPFLLHGKLGAYYLKERYGIEDKEIAMAITYHTTGRPEMSLMEKIIFTADYIEPGRTKQKNLSRLRALAFSDLDSCVAQIAEDTLEYLGTTGEPIDEMTSLTADYYKELITHR